VSRVRAGLLVAGLALPGTVDTLEAQTATGQINGTVRDESAAVVPGATVTIRSKLTGLSRMATTSADGDYVFARLPPGTYSVQAELAGFHVARETGVRLFVDNSIRVDLTVQLGDISETVEVKATPVALQSENANIGQTLTERQITELPLNRRNFLRLIFLQAGAVETTGEQGRFVQGAGDAISLQGARPTSNNFMIDGTANVDTALGTPAVILSLDAMEELTQQNKTYSAEYGFSANQINLISKSGSNELHGVAFLSGRNEAWDARNFFDDPEAEKPTLDQKQFGGTLSGSIVQDKTFFLVNYEGTRIERGRTQFFQVPTTEMLQGRFPGPVLDPWTGQPFPDNTIPPESWSRLATLAVSEGWFRTPNTDLPQGNHRAVLTFPQTQNQLTVRIDQDLGRFGRLFGRYTQTAFENEALGSMSPGGSGWEGGNQVFDQETRNWQATHTWPIRNNLVNVLRIGHLDARVETRGHPCPEAWIDALRLTGLFDLPPGTLRKCPVVRYGANNWIGGAQFAGSVSHQPMWDVSNTTTWVTGPHTLTFGAHVRRWWIERETGADEAGGYRFDASFTGDPLPDFLLGVYSLASVGQPTAYSALGNPKEFNFFYFAPYIQDDWRVSPRLTLNLGLRWDYRSVPYETNDHMSWRNLDYAPGGVWVADQNLANGIADGAFYQVSDRRSPENPDRFEVFAPRISFAYRPFESRETVIRGGYGLFYDSAEGREIEGSGDIYPYVSSINLQQSIGQEAPLDTTDSLFPSLPDPGPVTPAVGTFFAVMQSPEPRNPFVHQWSLGIQHMVHRTTTVELNYVGSHGQNLLMRRNIAQALPFTPERPSVAERKPFPNFQTFIDSDWSGWSDYHALNAVLTHRGRDLVATAAYTWAKSTDSKSAAAGIGASAFNGWQGFLNNHDIQRDHGLSDFDVAHRFVASFVWNLPFGQGQRFGGDATGVTQALIGGWQLNGIWLWQGGFPLTISAYDLGGLLDSGLNRADIVGDIHSGGGTADQWFNTAAFAQPAPGAFGSSGRNILRGPGINNLDLGLFKNFFIGEATLQLRVEAFNALNHTQFASVETSVFAPNFGTVVSARPARTVQLGVRFFW
jgi:hypothetical protein